jgi:ferrochelatase
MLRARLSADGPALPVYVGMRNWSPYIADTLRDMSEHGVRRALGIVLAPHRSEASWGRYTEAVEAGRAVLGSDAPTIEYAGGWFDHPLFVTTIAERIRDALGAPGTADDSHIVFTAHSLPLAMAEGSGYVSELEISCRLVAAAVGHSRYSLAYQSRSGRPGDAWLEPDVNESIRDLADRGVRRIMLVPIGFVCDHVEVLYDLDVEARATAEAAGVRMVRAETPNDHPTFVRMLAEVVRGHIGGAQQAAVDRHGRP